MTMKTEQLYEKYRPRTWSEVLGQEKTVERIKVLAQRGLSGRAYWIFYVFGSCFDLV